MSLGDELECQGARALRRGGAPRIDVTHTPYTDGGLRWGWVSLSLPLE